ncbi:YbaB/EbfC family nucleoid-associated protein [Nocardia sp. NPDC055029]
MANESARATMESALAGLQQQFKNITRVQEERAQLTASATVRKRVTVTVNADGTVIETKFSTDIGDLGYSEIAKAVTEAAQQAAAEVARRSQELLEPMRDQRARLPKLSELIAGMPDLQSEMPVLPEVSTAPPNSRERRDAAGSDGSSEHTAHRGVTDSSW